MSWEVPVVGEGIFPSLEAETLLDLGTEESSSSLEAIDVLVDAFEVPLGY